MTRGDGARTASAADRWARRLCRFAAVAFAFGAGAYVAWAGVFPWEFIYKGVKTGGQMVEVLRYHWSDKQDIADGLASSVGTKRVRLTTETGGGGRGCGTLSSLWATQGALQTSAQARMAAWPSSTAVSGVSA